MYHIVCALCNKVDNELFHKTLNSPVHVLHPLLPPPVVQKYNTILEADRTAGISQNADLI